jgi:hypothetical protein
MAFAAPGNMSPGGAYRSAPYSRVVTGAIAAPVNLSAQVLQAPNSSSGAIVIVGTSGTFVYKDAAGTTVTMTLPIGTFDFAGIAMSTLEVSTFVGTVLVYWHGTAGQ